MRLIICGGPRAGKTTHAKRINPAFRECDKLIGKLEWSDASAQIARWFAEPGPWVIEGTATVRGLRKFLTTYRGKSPADLVVYLDEPREPLKPGQVAMRKACMTIWNECKPMLKRVGCRYAEGDEALALLPAAQR